MIGGLLQTDNKNQVEQLPWIGSVPVLGTLFSSKNYQKNQTDLAIIVTPRLVRPARPGDGIRTPADDTLPPNDADFFLLGKTEVPVAGPGSPNSAERRIAAAGAQPFTGHMLDMPRGVLDAVH
jgi:pilus assembly protein CpaC